MAIDECDLCIYQRCSSIAMCIIQLFWTMFSEHIIYVVCYSDTWSDAESNAILHTNNSIVHDAQYALHTVHRTHKTEQISNKKL